VTVGPGFESSLTVEAELRYTVHFRAFIGQQYRLPGLPDGLFSNQKSQFGSNWRVLHWRMLVYFMYTWSFVIFYGHFVYIYIYIKVIWYIFSHFGILYLEKSGTPGVHGGKIARFSTVLWSQ
jgi:hypothetical protein